MSNWHELAWNEINQKTKPHGALGELEDLAVKLACVQESLKPQVYPVRVLVFAADHGVAQQGVSAYPPEVTAQMMANFASGGAAINVISNSVDASINVIDVGVNADLTDFQQLAHEKINRGTHDIAQYAAMTMDECQKAMQVGAKYSNQAFEDGVKTIALGEMGIANTTSAAAIICAITKHSTEQVVGRGTGIDDNVLKHKRSVVEQALNLHLGADDEPDPIRVLHTLGGFEIAAITGAILNAFELKTIVVIDGFISTAAALIACQINPAVREHLIFSHESVETGHKAVLNHLQARPLLNLRLRLGEGTGAALAIPIINAAANILCDMATFEQAGVSEKS